MFNKLIVMINKFFNNLVCLFVFFLIIGLIASYYLLPIISKEEVDPVVEYNVPSEIIAEAKRRNDVNKLVDQTLAINSNTNKLVDIENQNLSESERMNGYEFNSDKSLSQSNSVTDNISRFSDGYFEGLTYNEAVKKFRERKKDYYKRWNANIELNTYLAESLVVSTTEQRNSILSVFKMLNTEQIEYARKEALKTLTSNEVDSFFDDLNNFSEDMTPGEILEASDTAKIFQEIYNIADREYSIENESLKQEKETLKSLEENLKTFKHKNL